MSLLLKAARNSRSNRVRGLLWGFSGKRFDSFSAPELHNSSIYAHLCLKVQYDFEPDSLESRPLGPTVKLWEVAFKLFRFLHSFNSLQPPILTTSRKTPHSPHFSESHQLPENALEVRESRQWQITGVSESMAPR
jgi:hypothetical protein